MNVRLLARPGESRLKATLGSCTLHFDQLIALSHRQLLRRLPRSKNAESAKFMLITSHQTPHSFCHKRVGFGDEGLAHYTNLYGLGVPRKCKHMH